MDLELFKNLLVVLCVNTSEIRTSKCIDYMVNCVTINQKKVESDSFDYCEIKYKEGK